MIGLVYTFLKKLRAGLIFLVGRYLGKASFLILFLILCFTPLLFCADNKNESSYVLKRSKRRAVLEDVSVFLTLTDEQFKAAIAEIRDPFTFDRDIDTGGPSVAFEEGEEYDDYQILEYALFKLKPSGTVIKEGPKGSERVLVFPNGDTLKEGDIFKIRIKDKAYPIQLSRVTPQSYTFKRYDAEIEEFFNQEVFADVPQ